MRKALLISFVVLTILWGGSFLFQPDVGSFVEENTRRESLSVNVIDNDKVINGIYGLENRQSFVYLEITEEGLFRSVFIPKERPSAYAIAEGRVQDRDQHKYLQINASLQIRIEESSGSPLFFSEANGQPLKKVKITSKYFDAMEGEWIGAANTGPMSFDLKRNGAQFFAKVTGSFAENKCQLSLMGYMVSTSDLFLLPTTGTRAGPCAGMLFRMKRISIKKSDVSIFSSKGRVGVVSTYKE